jgi:hypothetical protein
MTFNPTSTVSLDLDAMLAEAGTIRLNGRVLTVRHMDGRAFHLFKNAGADDSAQQDAARRVLAMVIPDANEEDLAMLLVPQLMNPVLALSMRAISVAERALPKVEGQGETEGNGAAPAAMVDAPSPALA